MSIAEPLQPAQEEPRIGSLVLSVVLAFVVVAVFLGIYLGMNRATAVSAGQVVRVNTFQMPVATKTEEGADIPQTVPQQLLVLVQLHVQNRTDKTLTIQDIFGDVQLTDGTRRSTAAAGADFKRVFDMYPELAPMKADPLLTDTKIGPKQSVDGLVILDYPIQQSQWDLRKGLTLNVEFDNNTKLQMQAP